jgi:peptidoglycan/LPS O-acetylase OafA/YrhL
MTPERASELVTRWVRFYTRELPTPVAQRRIDEIGADLHDHVAHERARGTSDRRIALSILSRMARGVMADASWRRVQSLKGDLMKKPFFASLATTLGIAAIGIALLLVAAYDDDAPGVALMGILLIVAALALGVRTARRAR